jgi:hypothetical protein
MTNEWEKFDTLPPEARVDFEPEDIEKRFAKMKENIKKEIGETYEAIQLAFGKVFVDTVNELLVDCEIEINPISNDDRTGYRPDDLNLRFWPTDGENSLGSTMEHYRIKKARRPLSVALDDLVNLWDVERAEVVAILRHQADRIEKGKDDGS